MDEQGYSGQTSCLLLRRVPQVGRGSAARKRGQMHAMQFKVRFKNRKRSAVPEVPSLEAIVWPAHCLRAMWHALLLPAIKRQAVLLGGLPHRIYQNCHNSAASRMQVRDGSARHKKAV
jgi:hypothetical protein